MEGFLVQCNRPVLYFSLTSFAIPLLRIIFPERPLDYTGPRALLDLVFVLWMLATTLLLAGGVGWRVARWLRLMGLNRLEEALLALGIGLAILAYSVFALGLIGVLTPAWILGTLLVLGYFFRRDWMGILRAIPAWLSAIPRWLADLKIVEKTILIIGSMMLSLSLVNAFSPPWDYDGLMYHLEGPKQFLDAGRILYLPDLWQANGPFTIEMIFTIGLAFGSDVFAKLVHLSSWLGLVLATFLFAYRYMGRMEAWMATTILLGVPILPLISGLAYIDVAWAFYEFLAFFALMIWAEKKEAKFLVLAGMMSGVALGSKYLALRSILIYGLWVAWKSRTAGWGAMLARIGVFGGVAVAIGSPWYLKNWLFSGNPLFPFLWAGTGWNETRLSLLMDFLNSFGMGSGLIDFIRSPWFIYTQHEHFSTVFRYADFPSFLFVVAAAYPFTKKNPTLHSVAYVVLAGYALWFVGTQQIRFLIPIFPGLSLLSSHVLIRFSRAVRLRSAQLLALAGLPGGMLLVALIFQILILGWLSPLKSIIGLEAKSTFLARIVNDYSSMTYIRDHLPSDAQVLMLWDGQGYYCDPRCLPDADQSRWIYLADSTPDFDMLAKRLTRDGVTHLLISGDYQLIVEQDLTGKHEAALASFNNEFVPEYTRQVYQDGWVKLFELKEK